MYKEYKILQVSDGGCSTLLFGSANIPIKKLEQELNAHAANGWTVVFQFTERTRFLLVFSRETLVVTLGR